MFFPTRTGLLLGAICLLYSTQASAKKCLGITTPEIVSCQNEDLRLAQEHWKQYRDAECKAAFENWSGGTIRVSMELDCRQRLTESRIFDIWRQWLTHPDNTLPLLPKPNFSNRQ